MGEERLRVSPYRVARSDDGHRNAAPPAKAAERDDLLAALLEPHHPSWPWTINGDLPALLQLVVPNLVDHFDWSNEHLLLKSFLDPLDLGLSEMQALAAAVGCLFDAES